jgi:chromosomal replication initiation ATPase DnaA
MKVVNISRSSDVFDRAVEILCERSRRRNPLEARAWNAGQLLDRVARFAGTTRASMLGHARGKEVVAARHLAVAAIHMLHPEISLRDVGRIVQRGHKAVQNSLRYVENRPIEQFLASERELDAAAERLIAARRPDLQYPQLFGEPE